MAIAGRDDTWMDDAACAGVGFESFFDAPDRQPALRLCQTCPVRMPCLRLAVTSGIEWGVWGGLTPEGRRRLRRSELVA